MCLDYCSSSKAIGYVFKHLARRASWIINFSQDKHVRGWKQNLSNLIELLITHRSENQRQRARREFFEVMTQRLAARRIVSAVEQKRRLTTDHFESPGVFRKFE